MQLAEGRGLGDRDLQLCRIRRSLFCLQCRLRVLKIRLIVPRIEFEKQHPRRDISVVLDQWVDVGHCPCDARAELRKVSVDLRVVRSLVVPSVEPIAQCRHDKDCKDHKEQMLPRDLRLRWRTLFVFGRGYIQSLIHSRCCTHVSLLQSQSVLMSNTPY